MIDWVFKRLGICRHKYILCKSETESHIDQCYELTYYYCELCMKTKHKRKLIWIR
jgi:hypothetical protein